MRNRSGIWQKFGSRQLGPLTDLRIALFEIVDMCEPWVLLDRRFCRLGVTRGGGTFGSDRKVSSRERFVVHHDRACPCV
jgi:hypothetical protein